MFKKLFTLVLSISMVTAHAEATIEPTMQTGTSNNSTPSKSWPAAIGEIVLDTCQGVGILTCLKGAWTMLAADTYTMAKSQYKNFPRDLDYEIITTHHTRVGELTEGAAAVVIGYLMYKAASWLKYKDTPSCSTELHPCTLEDSSHPA